jgi:uncharacterized protein
MPLTTSPIDGSPMRPAQMLGVEYEICPASGGVWLDKGRLETLITFVREETLAVSPERWSYLDPPSKPAAPARRRGLWGFFGAGR